MPTRLGLAADDPICDARIWPRPLPTATRRGSWTGRSRSRQRSRCPRATAAGWPSRRAAASAVIRPVPVPPQGQAGL